MRILAVRFHRHYRYRRIDDVEANIEPIWTLSGELTIRALQQFDIPVNTCAAPEKTLPNLKDKLMCHELEMTLGG